MSHHGSTTQQGNASVRVASGAALLACAIILGAAHPSRGGTVAQEYAVKAAFLVNFAEFVDWPADARPEGDRIVIGVVGRDPFGAALDAIVASKNTTGERFLIRRFPSADELDACHILFVALPDEKSVQSLMASLGNKSTLTVGDSEAFARSGGMIRFFVDKERVRFEINQESAERASLKISAKLLRLQSKAGR